MPSPLTTPEERLGESVQRLKRWHLLWLAMICALVLILILGSWQSPVAPPFHFNGPECSQDCTRPLGRVVDAHFVSGDWGALRATEIHTEHYVLVVHGVGMVTLGTLLELRQHSDVQEACIVETENCEVIQ